MIADFLEAYGQWKDVKPSTIKHYYWVLRAWKVYLGREISPEDWNEGSINQYLAAKKGALSPWTLKQRRNSLLSLWKTGHEMGVIPAPPGRVRVVKTPDLVVRTWSPEDVNDMIAHSQKLSGKFRGMNVLKSLWWETWWRVAYDTGLRQSDQFSLEKEDVLNLAGRLTIVQIKTGYGVTVQMRPETLECCRRLAASHDGVMLFPCFWRNNHFSHAVRKFLTAAGKKGTATKMRKTSGTEVERIQPGMGWLHLGHKSPETTRKWYLDRLRAYGDRPLPPMEGH